MNIIKTNIDGVLILSYASSMTRVVTSSKDCIVCVLQPEDEEFETFIDSTEYENIQDINTRCDLGMPVL